MLIAGNWKMFKTQAETRAFCEAFDPPAGVEVVICPPYTSLEVAVGYGWPVFAQNVHAAAEGAYTGEISVAMLLELGVTGTLVGHSERRLYAGETDEDTARRAATALEAERDAGETEAVLRRQVSVLEPHPHLVIAYEPVWAIGTGKTATPEIAQEAHAFIKSILDLPVLYGGSVKPENAAELLAQPDVDGALVGGASLDPDSFAAICRASLLS